MKGADYIAAYLGKRGVTQVFEVAGGMITFLLDSLHRQAAIRIVSMHHEQSAAFAAEGVGRMRGFPSVAMATSGPGATNLLTAVGSCYFDSIPALFITGQVNRYEQKAGLAIRQLGFQETDIVSMAKPITKAAWQVVKSEDLPGLLEEAFMLSTTGRPGPVLLDVPMDIQRSEIADLKRLDFLPSHVSSQTDEDPQAFLVALQNDLQEAKRPLLLAGGGIRSGRCISDFRTLVESLNIPVVNSLMAVDVLPDGHSLRVGLIGSYGNRWGNTALSESDLLLVLGSRLDVRQTGSDTRAFKGRRVIYHVDCEQGELNNRVKGCVTLESELGPFLANANNRRITAPPCPDWIRRIQELKAQWPDTKELGDIEGINPNGFMHQLSRHAAKVAAFVVDVGQHQMWAAQSLDLQANQRFLTSGGMGAMGSALPLAIGACFAVSQPVAMIAGDGGFQLNIQELQTVTRNRLPIKMVIINNRCYGMVRQFQDSYFKGRLQSTVWGYSAPSFTAVAEAYGIPTSSVSDPAKTETALAAWMADPKSPYLLEVNIAMRANAYPKMAFGKPISEMEPLARPLDMEGT